MNIAKTKAADAYTSTAFYVSCSVIIFIICAQHMYLYTVYTPVYVYQSLTVMMS